MGSARLELATRGPGCGRCALRDDPEQVKRVVEGDRQIGTPCTDGAQGTPDTVTVSSWEARLGTPVRLGLAASTADDSDEISTKRCREGWKRCTGQGEFGGGRTAAWLHSGAQWN